MNHLRRGNQKWTIQRNWLHRPHKTKTNKTKNTTGLIVYMYIQTTILSITTRGSRNTCSCDYYKKTGYIILYQYNTPSFPEKCVKAGIVVIVLKKGRIYIYIYIYNILSVPCHSINRQHKNTFQKKCVKAGIVVKEGYIIFLISNMS